MVQEEEKTSLPEKIGTFKPIKLLGKGGMGEVWLAFDKTCNRHIAIKKIRDDLLKHSIVKKRFLNEATIAASLHHPSIIPVYQIYNTKTTIYYTMPHIKGSTLKNILKDTIQREKQNKTPHPIGNSLSELVRIFLQICQATSYCHSHQILHRDLKPENVMIGNFGEVILLDWGLACYANDLFQDETSTIEKVTPPTFTMPGKVLGTLSYMPPERIDGKKASYHTDIYALGVILYQLLTLHMPFKRSSIEKFKKIKQYEIIIDALESAPYRNIPKPLSEIAKKCLSTDQKQRYPSVKELIADLEAFTKGSAKWSFSMTLSADNKKDWEFQENILLNNNRSIIEEAHWDSWAYLMISKNGFSGNTKISSSIIFDHNTEGAGFLIGIPDAEERNSLQDGFSFWLSSTKANTVTLYRQGIEIKSSKAFHFNINTPYTIDIEKTDDSLRLFIDKKLIIDYNSYLPIIGTHIGFICKDFNYTISPLNIYIGSPSLKVGCLAVPNALLSSKNFSAAFNEYEKISISFEGRSEAQKALFKGGICLTEIYKQTNDPARKKTLAEKAHQLFDQLSINTPSPLEYLGKSIVYRLQNDFTEEIKSIIYSLLKHEENHLVFIIHEHLIFRFYEELQSSRKKAFKLALTLLQYIKTPLPSTVLDTIVSLIEPQIKIYPPLSIARSDYTHYIHNLTLDLSFWLGENHILQKTIENNHAPEDDILQQIQAKAHHLLELLTPHHTEPYDHSSIEKAFPSLQHQLKKQSVSILPNILEKLHSKVGSSFWKSQLSCCQIWTHLLLKEHEKASNLLKTLDKNHDHYHFLKGCLLGNTCSYQELLNHFHPKTGSPSLHLFNQYLHSKYQLTKSKEDESFHYEKIDLYRKLILFYHSIGKNTRANFFERKLIKTTQYRTIE